MIRNALGAVLVAALIVTAGCGGSVTSGPTATADGTGSGTDGSGAGDAGTVSFYISDEPNAIGDFAHLNVTVTRVGLHRVGDAAAGPNGTATNGTATADGGDGPATGSPTATGTPTEEGEGAESDDDGEWVEYEVDRRTVDLTELTGANATRLDVLEAPAGTYDKVFVYVDDIDATLTTGESATVKLPSERLHINRRFTVGDGEDVEFVFDVSPHKAGRSGKYILKPVVSQSGTGSEVDIRDIGGRANAALDARFVGPVERGANATVKVVGPDGPVAGATVSMGNDVLGETGADGTLTFAVPEGVTSLELTVRADGEEAELAAEFARSTEADEGADEGDEEADDDGGSDGSSGRNESGR